jgi:hypothetical protein
MIEAIVVCAFLYCVVVPAFIIAGVWAMGVHYHQKYLEPKLKHLYKAVKAKRIYVSSHPDLPDLKCPMAPSIMETNGKDDQPDEAKMKDIQDKLRGSY